MSKRYPRNFHPQGKHDSKKRYRHSRDMEEMVAPKRSWSYHDLMCVNPLTSTQQAFFRAFAEGEHIVAFGSAGTGKSFVALYLALNELLEPGSRYTNIILVRSAVPSRDLGFMPGDEKEKTEYYERPYIDILHELVGRYTTYEDMKKEGLIHFVTTSFVRSMTWNNAIVIVDEGQNMAFHEINSVITRLGQHSRLIFLGDSAQNDLITKRNDISGMDRFLKVAKHMNEFTMLHFTHDDIVRSEFVKSWIIACENTPS